MRSAYSLNNDKARTKTSILSELDFDLRDSNEHNSSIVKYASVPFLYFDFVFIIAQKREKLKVKNTLE